QAHTSCDSASNRPTTLPRTQSTEAPAPGKPGRDLNGTDMCNLGGSPVAKEIQSRREEGQSAFGIRLVRAGARPLSSIAAPLTNADWTEARSSRESYRVDEQVDSYFTFSGASGQVPGILA